jgi:hypothetical protein
VDCRRGDDTVAGGVDDLFAAVDAVAAGPDLGVCGLAIGVDDDLAFVVDGEPKGLQLARALLLPDRLDDEARRKRALLAGAVLDGQAADDVAAFDADGVPARCASSTATASISGRRS